MNKIDEAIRCESIAGNNRTRRSLAAAVLPIRKVDEEPLFENNPQTISFLPARGPDSGALSYALSPSPGGHLKWLRELDHAISPGIPTLRSIFTSVEIAARIHFVATVGESE